MDTFAWVTLGLLVWMVAGTAFERDVEVLRNARRAHSIADWIGGVILAVVGIALFALGTTFLAQALSVGQIALIVWALLSFGGLVLILRLSRAQREAWLRNAPVLRHIPPGRRAEVAVYVASVGLLLFIVISVMTDF